MWLAITGIWVTISAAIYGYLIHSAKAAEDDICSACGKKDCSGCENCSIIEEDLHKAA